MRRPFVLLLTLLAMVLILSLVGCSSPPAPILRTAPPSLSAIAGGAVKVRASADATRGRIASARANVSQARGNADQLAGVVSEDLKPLVRNLQLRLTAAQADIDSATALVTQLTAQADALRTETDRVQTEVSEVTRERDVATAQALHRARQLVEVTAAKQHQTWLAWKWRFIAAGIAAAVAAFFVARQFFPLLKLI